MKSFCSIFALGFILLLTACSSVPKDPAERFYGKWACEGDGATLEAEVKSGSIQATFREQHRDGTNVSIQYELAGLVANPRPFSAKITVKLLHHTSTNEGKGNVEFTKDGAIIHADGQSRPLSLILKDDNTMVMGDGEDDLTCKRSK